MDYFLEIIFNKFEREYWSLVLGILGHETIKYLGFEENKIIKKTEDYTGKTHRKA